MIAITRVKMGRVVVEEIHRYDDPIEPADFRHMLIIVVELVRLYEALLTDLHGGGRKSLNHG